MVKSEKNREQQEEKRLRSNSAGTAAPNETEQPQQETPQPTGGAEGVTPLDPVDISQERELLEQQQEAARQAAEQQIDRAVEEGVAELERAQEEAQPGFQSQRDRIDIEERQALDRQALYAEMRGDRGGIGQAQYASIQNTAAVNRRQVNLEQQRLATETARQIEDLRRKGEFQKADALLELTQQHLAALLELERWAKEQNLSIEQFNIELARWRAEYAWQVQRFGIETELQLARLAGGSYGRTQTERGFLGDLARKLQDLGLTLSPELAAALGWTEGPYTEHLQETGREPEQEQTGTGAPFQLFESWLSALSHSTDKQETYRQLQGSEWFARLSPEQKQRLEEAMG